jgi:sodium/potassium-transporting ATPase subunit alpha
LSKEVKITEHLLTLKELCEKLKTDTENGISDAEAEIRHKRDGPNAFTPPKLTPGWVLYLREMTTGFAIIIWLAAIASFVIYGINLDAENVSYNQIILDFKLKFEFYFSSTIWVLH